MDAVCTYALGTQTLTGTTEIMFIEFIFYLFIFFPVPLWLSESVSARVVDDEITLTQKDISTLTDSFIE